MNKLLTKMHFDGFRATPLLWGGILEGLEMIGQVNRNVAGYPVVDTDKHIPLGKLIEQFVSFELEQDKNIQILKSNAQVFEDQITIGELDLLIKHLENYVHLEVVYKFYLYDPAIANELHRWVGPNRKDSLVHKLTKLKEKQLPLLYHPATADILNELNLTSAKFTQQLYFKAQLFLPIDYKRKLDLINNDCVKGFYMRMKDLTSFMHCTFHIPPKLDWLIEPHLGVERLSFQSFEHSVVRILNEGTSPLCWMRLPDGSLEKIFVVWWE